MGRFREVEKSVIADQRGYPPLMQADPSLETSKPIAAENAENAEQVNLRVLRVLCG
jgi:hypothetical protein